MSSISSVSSSPVPLPAPITTPKAPATPAVVNPSTSGVVAAELAKSNAAQSNSYRNSFGDSVSITGIVVKDRDGDGGVGLPAGKPAAPAR